MKKEVELILKFLILFLAIFTGCARTPPNHSNLKKIETFLNEFLFVEGGVYTLFGDKPVTEMAIFIGSNEDLIELTPEQSLAATPLDPSIAKNWETWKHHIAKLPLKTFILHDRSCPSDPTLRFYSIVNTQAVRDLLHKHKKAFQDITGIDFNEDAIIDEFTSDTSSFWQKAFQDHYLMGLLYGFGEENALYFAKQIATNQTLIRFSAKEDPFASMHQFPIPSFALSPEDTMTDHYQQQRTKIERLYRNKNMVEVSVQRLTE